MLLTNATISKDMSSKLSLSFSRCNRQQKSNQNNTEGIRERQGVPNFVFFFLHFAC